MALPLKNNTSEYLLYLAACVTGQTEGIGNANGGDNAFNLECPGTTPTEPNRFVSQVSLLQGTSSDGSTYLSGIRLACNDGLALEALANRDPSEDPDTKYSAPSDGSSFGSPGYFVASAQQGTYVVIIGGNRFTFDVVGFLRVQSNSVSQAGSGTGEVLTFATPQGSILRGIGGRYGNAFDYLYVTYTSCTS